jgi:hypothetical protein
VLEQVKVQRIQIWLACGQFNEFFSTSPSDIVRVIENIALETAKICRSTIMHVLTAGDTFAIGFGRSYKKEI